MNFTTCTHYVNISAVPTERVHCKAYGNIVFKQHIYYLMINQIIIELEYPFAVLHFRNGFFHIPICWILELRFILLPLKLIFYPVILFFKFLDTNTAAPNAASSVFAGISSGILKVSSK